MSEEFEIFKRFTFDAAHHLASNVPAGHRCAKLHGHSFEVEVYIQGAAEPQKGWVMDFLEFDAALEPLRAELDHSYLNEIAGLEVPTMENICRWIWRRLAPQFPNLSRIIVRRGSFGEGCVYKGPAR